MDGSTYVYGNIPPVRLWKPYLKSSCDHTVLYVFGFHVSNERLQVLTKGQWNGTGNGDRFDTKGGVSSVFVLCSVGKCLPWEFPTLFFDCRQKNNVKTSYLLVNRQREDEELLGSLSR